MTSEEATVTAIPTPPSLRGEDLGFQQLSHLKLPPEPNWFVKGVLGPGQFTGGHGKWKVGKTTFFMSMIATAQRGEPFLGLPTRDPGPVLMLIEDNLTSFKAYAKRLGIVEDKIFAISRRSLRKGIAGFGWPEIADAVGQYAAGLGAGVVYVDLNPWAGLVAEGAENDAPSVQAACDPALRLTGEDIAVYASLQSNNAGGIRGSSAWGANLDIIIGLRRPDDDEHLPRTARLIDGIGRWETIPDHLVADLVDKNRYEILGRSTSEAKTRTADQAILTHAHEKGPVTREVVMELTNYKLGAAKEIIKRLEKAGRLEQVEGTGVGRKKAEYAFVERDEVPI